jgi:hypothetical protein
MQDRSQYWEECPRAERSQDPGFGRSIQRLRRASIKSHEPGSERRI